jgi:hypothetical protein
MLSAIEIYNKPDFKYREETFSILAINAWELLLKAQLLKENKYNMRALYELEPVLKKNGEKSKRTKPKLNRSGNPSTISLFKAIMRLEKVGVSISLNLQSSIESLTELRDNAIHFHNEKTITKQLQELGFACVKNYMNLLKDWEVDIDLSKYNFYLMPLAYVDSKIDSDSVLTDEIRNYLAFVENKVQTSNKEEKEFDIAIGVDVKFKKSNSFGGIGVQFDKDGVPVNLSEEDIRQRFPFAYGDVVKKAKERYLDFKQGKIFNAEMKKIKADKKLHYNRLLDPKNPSSTKRTFYSSNIWKVLDQVYTKN